MVMSKTALDGIDVAIVGASGAVGEAMREILEERNFPVRNLHLVASERSAGTRLQFQGKALVVEDLANFDFGQVQIGLFSAGGAISAEFAPKAAAAGCIVIDNTSYFRQDPQIPLVVPEVNAHRIGDYGDRRIIANPNCSTIQMLVALKPIYDAVGIERIIVSTYQAVSGAGKRGVETLASQAARLLNGQPIEQEIFPQQIAFNCLPYGWPMEDNGYTNEEMKMIWETQKIFEDDEIKVNPTCVRVPVFYGHSEAVHIEMKSPLDASAASQLMAKAAGLQVINDTEKPDFPSPVRDAAGSDLVYVGRICQDLDSDCGLNLWIVSDNIRKGAALNSIQIAEVLLKHL